MGKQDITQRRVEEVPILVTRFEDSGKCDCCPNGVHSWFRVQFRGIQSYRKFSGIEDAEGLIEDFLKECHAEGFNGRKLRITLEVVAE